MIKNVHVVIKNVINVISIVKLLLKQFFEMIVGRFSTDFRYASQKNSNMIHILGNGPCLEKSLGYIKESDDVLMVNFAVNTPLFWKFKPKYLCIADPDMFSPIISEYFEEKKKELFENLMNVNWPMVLIIPSVAKKKCTFPLNGSIHVRYVNATYLSYETYNLHSFYKTNIAAPLFQNVVNMAIYCMLQESYKSIKLHGVDSDSYKQISINDNNQMVIEDRHFYGKTQLLYSEHCESFNAGTLYKRLECEVHMFKAHIELAKYAKYLGANVYNLSPVSMIDAYERISQSNEDMAEQ